VKKLPSLSVRRPNVSGGHVWGDERKAVGSEPPTALLSEHTQYNQQNQTLNQHDCRHREHYLFRGDLLAELSSLKARLFVALPRLQFAAALCEISGSILTLRVFHLMHRERHVTVPRLAFGCRGPKPPSPHPRSWDHGSHEFLN
jgi:hypothetical protein